MPIGFGAGEVIFVLILVLVIFGAGRVPNVLTQMGRGVRSFREETAAVSPPTSAPGADRPEVRPEPPVR